jgi:hypothetical protein
MKSKKTGMRRLSDDQVDRLLAGDHDADPILGAYLAQLRTIGSGEPQPDVANRHVEGIVAEAQAVHQRRAAHNRRVLPHRLVDRLGHSPVPRNVVAGFTAVLLTAGMAGAATGNLPDPIQDLVSDAMSRVGIDIPAATDFTENARAVLPAPILGEIEGPDGAGSGVADEGPDTVLGCSGPVVVEGCGGTD